MDAATFRSQEDPFWARALQTAPVGTEPTRSRTMAETQTQGTTPAKNDDAAGDDTSRLDFILDIGLDIAVELGRGRMEIQEILHLGPGSVIELSKLAGEPLDVLVNGRLMARGEAVIVGEKFGIRITEVVSKSERIAGLRGA